MGQEISLLITKKEIHPNSIPEDQIYFKENGYHIFPLDIDGHEFELITHTLKKFEYFKEVTENRLVFSENVNHIIDLVMAIRAKTFLLERYADWGDMPYEWFILLVKEGKIFQQNDYDSIEDVLGYFKEGEDIGINKYRNYEACVRLFKNKGI